jgi:hypothetical protein
VDPHILRPAPPPTGPETRPFSAAPFRRAIVLRVHGDAGEAEVEDDFHHFRVGMVMGGGAIRSISGEAVRHPWSLCPLAARELQRLTGMALSPDPSAVAGYVEAHDHCTHLLALAGLLQALAAQGRERRRYDLEVAASPDETLRATLKRDGEPMFAWTTSADAILDPYPGVSLRRSFSDWARATFDPEGHEAAMVLRRGIFVGKSRHRSNLDARRTAADGASNLGGCFVLQPGRAELALRRRGSTVSFPPDGAGPLAND